MTQTTNACPECDDVNITPLSQSDAEWCCEACGEYFDEPQVREVYDTPSIPKNTLGAELDEASPADLGGTQ